MSKDTLRKEIKSRPRLTMAEIEEKSERISSALFGIDELLSAKVVLVYMSYGAEPVTDGIIARLSECGKRVLIPVVCGGEMFTAEYDSNTEIEYGAYGIRQPKNPIFTEETPDVSVTPMVGFDENKVRLGHGKGYYDRYFDGKRGIFKIGLCFERGKCYHIDKDAYDVDMDVVITEDKLYI